MQVNGLMEAGLLPPEEKRPQTGVIAAQQVLDPIYNIFRPLLRLEVVVWGTRTLLVAMPVKSVVGHYVYASWRPVEEETFELVERVEKLTKYLHQAKTGDPF
ncbi:hypothetical protein SLA2020_247650 [Shorea laevis]